MKRSKADHFLLRLLVELDDTGLPVLLGIIRNISEPTLENLLFQCMTVYGPTLTKKLNQYLQSDIWGKFFSVGGVCISREGSIQLFVMEDVYADFKALIDSTALIDTIGHVVTKQAEKELLGKITRRATKSILKTVEDMGQDDIEKKDVVLLNNSVVQNKLREIVGKALNSKGIAVTLSNIEIIHDAIPNDIGTDGSLLTPELETALIHTISEYLRQMTILKQ